MFSNLRKAADLYNELGWKKSFKIIASKAIGKFAALFYEKIEDVIIYWDLSEEKTFKIKNILHVEHLDASDIPILKEFCEKNKLKDQFGKFQNYLENGFHGFRVMVDTQMIGFMWYVDNRIPRQQNHPALTLYNIQLRDNEVYMFDNFLLEEFRGNANAIEGMYHMRKRLLERGYLSAKAYVRASNRPARWIYSVHGWKNERNYVRHKFFQTILVGDKCVFVKNSPHSAVHKFDYRMVLSFR